MATDNFTQALALVLKHEGGYVDHPRDPGGATNLGVTIGTLSNWLGRPATKAEVRALTKETVAPIYRKNYWDKVRGDQLPAGVDYAVFDFAVNSGVSRAAKYLQNVVGTAPDGAIGPATLAAVAARPADAVVADLCAQRMAFLRRLDTWDTFGKGWAARVTGVQKTALRWAKSPPAAPEVAAPTPPAGAEPAKPGFWSGLLSTIRGNMQKGA